MDECDSKWDVNFWGEFEDYKEEFNSEWLCLDERWAFQIWQIMPCFYNQENLDVLR